MNLQRTIRKGVSQIKDGPKGWLVLLALAAVLHVATSTAVFVIGRAQIMPGQFNRDGLGAFASDSFFYQSDLAALTDKLKSQGPITWLKAVAPLHVKAYSLSYLPFSFWTGPNILTFEPLNLFYYLAILGLVYKLGETVFDRQTGLISMTVMALWPSFLMHTTQLIRDPILIVAILVFILVISHWLAKVPRFYWSLLAVIPAVLAVLTIWIVRLAMWDAVRVIMLTGLVLLLARHLLKRRLFLGPIINAIILSFAIMTIPQSHAVKSQQRRESDGKRPLLAERVATLTLWQRIGQRRSAFGDLRRIESSSTASNIDDEVTFNTMGDLVRYLPRAMALGFFAPFPNMWFAKGGQVGRTGRLLAGFETLVTYMMELLALVGLWHARKNLAAWLLAVTTVAGVTALGLIVLNIGSLYRFRYPFLILIVIFAAGGSLHLLRRSAEQQKTGSP